MEEEEELNAFGRHVTTDLIEWLAHKIIEGSTDRLAQWRTLEHFWKQLWGDDSENAPQHGTLYLRYRLAKVIVAIGHCDPYDRDVVEAAGAPSPAGKGKKQQSKSNILSPALPMAKWSRSHWTDLIRMLDHLATMLVRKDATKEGGDDDEDNEPDPERENSKLFTQNVEKVLRYCRINRALSAFRWTLEEQLDEEVGHRPQVDAGALIQFSNAIEEDFKDDATALKALKTILVTTGNKAGATSTRSHGISLVSLEELKEILHQSKPFSLYHLLEKVEALIRRWYETILIPVKQPVLTLLQYHGDAQEDEMQVLAAHAASAAKKKSVVADEEEQDENQEPRRKVARLAKQSVVMDVEYEDGSEAPPKAHSNVARLQAARETLREEGGPDPLEESRAVAATAAAGAASNKPAGATFYEKKRSAKKVVFEDSDDDEEDEETGGAKLSAVPARAKVPSPSQEPVGTLVRERNEDGTLKRKRFTETEKTAIKEGIKAHGVGKWSTIKAAYKEILLARTATNIKDCYRTMLKRGEI